ncbi:MAG TPA: ZIP family metal transporter [Polyangia bacterium]|nr:ZIP family metal transporter [Polyangia bacterium]
MPAGPTATIWIWVMAAVVLDGGAALVAGLVPEGWLEAARDPLVGFAAGVLLATTFLDVLPETLRALPPQAALAIVLGTLAVMIVLEWTIGHRATSGAGARRLAAILLGADAFHNVADGAAIAAAFLASPRVGLITAGAVIVHEVPEEVADYVLLRQAGLSRGRALAAMTGVQLTAAVGAIATLVGSAASPLVSSFALAVAGGTFLHIAEVDLVPTFLAGRARGRRRARAVLALCAGIALVIVGTNTGGGGQR